MKQWLDNIKNIFNEYLDEGKVYYKVVKDFFLDYKNIWPKIKKSIQNTENRKKYITGVIFLAFLNLLIINMLFSYSFFIKKAEFPILQHKVGNIYLGKNDYILLIYQQDAEEKYHLVNRIPSGAYSYSGFKCQNGSILIYDEKEKLTSVDLSRKDVCSIYFDINKNIDILINIMIEDNIGSNTYSIDNKIPAFGYTYDHYECENNSNIKYDSNRHKITLSTTQKDKCNIYFKKNIENINVKFFMETEPNNKNYIENNTIISNNLYLLDTKQSYCINDKKERIDNNIIYDEGYVNLVSKNVTDCIVYLNKNE